MKRKIIAVQIPETVLTKIKDYQKQHFCTTLSAACVKIWITFFGMEKE